MVVCLQSHIALIFLVQAFSGRHSEREEKRKDKMKNREQVSLPFPLFLSLQAGSYPGTVQPLGNDEGVTCKQIPRCAIIKRLLGAIRPQPHLVSQSLQSVCFTHNHVRTHRGMIWSEVL